MKKAIGIDLGTTNSVVAFKDTTVKILRNQENEELTRSCVGDQNGELRVGRMAYQLLERDPANTVLSVKRLMGGAIHDQMVQDMIKNPYYKYNIVPLQGGTADAVAIILGGKQFTPEQLSAEILKKLKRDAEEKLGDEVTHAVITVPAYFTEKQKNATKVAAQLAGLKVQKLLAEPTAAAIAYGVDNLKSDEARTVLVYDFGGGTFDLSILNMVNGNYLEAGTGGDRWLGGDDIDRKLQELIFERVEKEYSLDDLADLIEKLPEKKRFQFEGQLRYKTEETKLQLSSMKSASIQIDNILEDANGDWIDIDVTIKREEFEALIRPMVIRSMELIDSLLEEVQYDMSVIDNILLIGGTSCIPLVKEMMIEKYGEDKVKTADKPMLAVAEGAAILAHRLGSDNSVDAIPEADVLEISYSTNHNYFIKLITSTGAVLEKIIEKNSPLPASTSRIFKTTTSNQKIVKVDIHSDVENGSLERQTFGFFALDENLPFGSDLVFDFKLGVENADEVLSVEVHPKGQKDKKKSIILGRGHFDEKALGTIEELSTKARNAIQKWILQDKYFLYAADLVKQAEAIGPNNDLNDRWLQIEEEAKTQFEKIKQEDEQEDPGRTHLIDIAVSLLNNYRDLMEYADINNLIRLVKDHQSADEEKRLAIIEEINQMMNNYVPVLILNLIKWASERALERPSMDMGSTDAQDDSSFLARAHDEIFAFLRSREEDKIEKGLTLLNETYPTAQKYFNS